MRARVALLLAYLLLVIPAEAGPVGASGGLQSKHRVDTLRAQWLLPTRNSREIRAIAVNVYRRTNVDTGEVTLSAVAGRSLCSVDGGVVRACVIPVSRYRVTTYETDPAFATARVVIERGRREHQVAFAAGAPYAYAPPVDHGPSTSCKDGTVTTLYLTAKNATAEGRVFGRDVSTAAEIEAERESEKMIQTLEVEECP